VDPINALSFPLEIRGASNLVRTITAQIRSAIVAGKMANGQRMPSTRELAAACKVSRNTIIAAYEQLTAESLIYSERGRGSFVSYEAREPLPRLNDDKSNLTTKLVPQYREKCVDDILPRKHDAPFNFSIGRPETKYFPFSAWKRALNKAFNHLPHNLTGTPEPQGNEDLRHALARHLTTYRSIACQANELVVTTGTQQSLNIIANLLVERGKSKVAIESPGYPMAYHVFQSAGAKMCPIPVDEKGILVHQIPKDVSIIYVTPSHQFPMGVLLSAERRMALLEFAAKNGIIIIEDDYDSELRFTGQSIDALKMNDVCDVVFYLTSLSKIMFPDIKTGLVIPPKWARSAFLAAKMQSDWSNPQYIQGALAKFIGYGDLYKYQRKMKRIYKKRFDCLNATLMKYPDIVKRVFVSQAGVHLCAELHEHIDAQVLASSALHMGVYVSSIKQYVMHDSTLNGLIFGFGQIEISRIPEGVSKLFKHSACIKIRE
jgi:GntR family transcriptional regulator/MocR family aminotransferase